MTPDFEQIAGEIIAACVIERNSIDVGAGTGTVPGVVADYLRQVWNARGAADISTVNAAYLTAPLDDVVSAIRNLDQPAGGKP